jgi:quercetin dioxygenase-like cupin family protein
MSSDAKCVSQDEIEQAWHQRGFSCRLLSDEPGQVWEDYAQESDALLLVLVGELEVDLGDDTCRLVPGMEFILPTGACHTFRTTGDCPSTWLRGYGREYACTD